MAPNVTDYIECAVDPGAVSARLSTFAHSWAVVIGIDAYAHGIPPLRTAGNDARRLAQILTDIHGYNVCLLDTTATLAALRTLLTETLPAHVGPDDRVLFYFAGHGVALDGDDGPAGYLIPQDAVPDDAASFLAMTDLHQALTALSCRHLLAILDCCFAGAFRWVGTRHLQPLPAVIHRERYERFIRDPAWQVLTSTAYNEQALDVLAGDVLGARGEALPHSPFALALFRALEAGEADMVPREGGDGVITATELYLYLREWVEGQVAQRGARWQTPQLWPLRKHDRGEYIFLVPGREPDLPPAPDLTVTTNPYRGLQPYEEEHRALFFGRTKLVEELVATVQRQPLTVVVGASGTGKSSLIRAGLIPALGGSHCPDQIDIARSDTPWLVLPAIRPGPTPLQALHTLLAAHLADIGSAASLDNLRDNPDALSDLVTVWRTANVEDWLLLVIDQAEELIALCRHDERKQFLTLLANALATHPDCLRIVLVLRSDFEPPLAESELGRHWTAARFVVPPMNQDELREVIEGPAAVRVLYFEPYELVDTLINEVVQVPGALPLLSFTLSELYVTYLASERDNRALTEEDYRALGGVVGALRTRATQELNALDAAHQATLRRVLLRMINVAGGEVARRRVGRSELAYSDEAENARVEDVIKRLVAARLLVEGQEGGESYVEPAHDALVRSWDRLLVWKREAEEDLPLQRRVAQAAEEWERMEDAKAQRGLLWTNNPRLPQLAQLLERDGSDGGEASWLNRRETTFVRASVRQRQRNRQRLMAAVGAVLIALVALTLVAWYQRNQAVESEASALAAAKAEAQARVEAEEQKTEAVRQARLARAGQLAAQSQASFERYPQRSLLLALQALQVADDLRVPAAEQALRDVLANTGGRVLGGAEDTINTVAISPDSHWLVTGGLDATARLWDLTAHDPTAKSIVLRGHNRSLSAAVISPDSHWLATGSWDGGVRLWDLTAADPVATSVVLPGHEQSISASAVAISPDNHWLVTGSADATARLWDLTAPDPAVTSVALRGHLGWITSAAFSSDGRWLVTGSQDTTARLWNLAAPNPAAKPLILTGHSGPISSVAISPNSRWLTTGSNDGNARLWSLAAADPAAAAFALSEAKGAIAISPDSHWLVTGGREGTARLWDLTTADPAAAPIVLRSHGGRVTDIAIISLDSHWLVTVTNGEAVDLWNLRLEELADLACRTAGRNLTWEEWVEYFGGAPYLRTCPSLPEPPSEAKE